MNYTFVAFPGSDGAGVVVRTRGVMTDAKPAKVNAETKLPAIKLNYEKGFTQILATALSAVKDYTQNLKNMGITAVNYATKATVSGYKKLRTNSIVLGKASTNYNNSDKVDVLPIIVMEKPKEEVKEEPRMTVPVAPVVNIDEEVHGRHERTGEVPVTAVKEAVESNTPPVTPSPMISRTERNAISSESKNETKAGDMDLYNNLLHNGGDDISRQLQGINSEISKEKAENKKIADKTTEAVKYLEQLAAEVEGIEREKKEKLNKEVEAKQAELEAIKQEQLERTNNLTSVLEQISKLEAQRKALIEENDNY